MVSDRVIVLGGRESRLHGKGRDETTQPARKHVPERRSGQGMPTKLQGIANKAKECKNHKFQNLYHLLNKDLLRASFFQLKKNAAPGVDKVSYYEYQRDLENNLEELVTSLKNESYHAKLIRRQYIPKSDDKLRPLGIPCVVDKVVQKGVATILSAIYEQDFLDSSYGYRPNRGAQGATKELSMGLQFGPYGWIVEADIQGYFDNIDHEWLIKMLSERIADQKLLHLIQKWLNAGVLDITGLVICPATGTPQGGIISPILSNVYLHYVVDLWFEKIIVPQCKGRAKIIRYADDFVCAFQFHKEAKKFYTVLGKRLQKFGLTLAPDKTRILRFNRFHIGNGFFEFLGFEFRWGRNRNGKPQVWRTTARKKLRKAISTFKEWIMEARNHGNRQIFKTLKLKYQGYWNYYGVIGNSERLGEFYYITIGILFKWLNRRSQRASCKWGNFKALIKRC